MNLVRRRFFLPVYRCPGCGTTNFFSEDSRYRRLSDVWAKRSVKSQGYN